MVVVVDVLGLLQGILFKGRTCFWDIDVAADIVQGEYFYPTPKDLSDFTQLMLVVGCEYYLHNNFEYNYDNLGQLFFQRSQVVFVVLVVFINLLFNLHFHFVKTFAIDADDGTL